MRSFACAVLIIAISSGSSQANCGMKPAFQQADNNGKSSVSVWEDAKSQALLFADGLHVNTDGTKRSYKVDDFWGHGDAVNNLCNAMKDACGGDTDLKARRILTQKAKAKGWPADLTRQTKISPDIIAFKSDGKPCDEIDGFLVSATALKNPKISDQCSLKRYADAMTVPAIVLPGRVKDATPTEFENRDARVGDLAAILSGDGKLLTYAVVGDIGPARELGEASIALAGTLRGKTKEPENYCEVRGKPASKCSGKDYKGRGWDVGKTYVLVFPNTRVTDEPYMSKDRIEQDASRSLASWGGAERFKSCASAYK